MRPIALVLLIAGSTAAHAQRSTTDILRENASMTLERSALEDSLTSIPSSRQRANALRRYGQTDDRSTLLTVLRVARTIPNTTDKSRLLDDLAPRYLSRDDRALSAAFFRAVRTVPSSEELRDLLIDVVPFAAKSADIANQLIDVARIVPSSPDRSDVLTALVEGGAVRGNDVRENFADALREIPGEYDRQRVARATVRVSRQ